MEILHCLKGVGMMMLVKSRKSKFSIITYSADTYRIAGKFGMEFNLAVWRITEKPPN